MKSYLQDQVLNNDLSRMRISENRLSIQSSASLITITNNQNSNVDEADVLKNDGNYIYTASGRFLSIILAFPFNDARLVSTISLTHEGNAIFIEGDYLAVFGT